MLFAVVKGGILTHALKNQYRITSLPTLIVFSSVDLDGMQSPSVWMILATRSMHPICCHTTPFWSGHITETAISEGWAAARGMDHVEGLFLYRYTGGSLASLHLHYALFLALICARMARRVTEQ